MEDVIKIEGEIGDAFWSWDPITPDYVRERITEDSDTIRLIINSPGGVCFDGFAIHDLLAQSGKKVIAEINGLCASIATVIALAADEITMTENSDFMIHLPWGGVFGNADDMDSYIKLLRNMEQKAAKVYADYTDMTIKQALDLMKAETWMTAKQAKDYGFVSKVIKTNKKPSQEFTVKAFATVNKSDQFSKEKYAACASASLINHNKSNITKMANEKKGNSPYKKLMNWLEKEINTEAAAAMQITLADGSIADVETEANEPVEGDIVTKDGEPIENETIITKDGDEITTEKDGKITKVEKSEEIQNRKEVENIKALEQKINAQIKAQQESFTTQMNALQESIKAKDETINELKSKLEAEQQSGKDFKQQVQNFLKMSESKFEPEQEEQQFSRVDDEGVQRPNAMVARAQQRKEQMLNKQKAAAEQQ